MASPERYRVYALLNFVGTPLTRLLGYAPGWSGLGEDLPKGVFQQWVGWVMSERYLFDDPALKALANFSRFEGAMISTVAAADRGRHFYALRASKLLSSSSFMGNGYQEKFTRPEDMKAWLLDNQIGSVTVDTSDESMQYGHNKMLLPVLAADPAAFRPVWRGTREDGTIALFQTAASAAPPDHPQKMLADQAPYGVT